MNRIRTFLDDRLFPLIVGYTISRAHIVFLLCLWVALICGGAFTAFELVGGNYTNGLSALVSCIVLLQTVRHEQASQKRHKENKALHAESKALHEKTHALHEKTQLVQAQITEHVEALVASDHKGRKTSK